MRHILKGTEPLSYTQWMGSANSNWQPTWANLANPEKAELKETLLKEQGYLCCYCCRHIDPDNSHIEHLKPRKTYSHLALDYSNLLACCLGEAEDPPPEQCHCGHHKKEWYDPALFVSPLNAQCEAHFAYTAYGDIAPSQTSPSIAAAQETIKHLNLDCKKLRRLRRSAIDAGLTGTATFTAAEMELWIAGLARANEEGELVEFHPAIIAILQGLI